MKIIIGGAGAVGTHLAALLSNEKQDIILMDEDKDKLSTMDSNFDLMTVCASPTSIQALKNAGVDDADLFIAVMPEESRNMTACMLATSLGAKKTVARIDNYEYLCRTEFLNELGDTVDSTAFYDAGTDCCFVLLSASANVIGIEVKCVVVILIHFNHTFLIKYITLDYIK